MSFSVDVHAQVCVCMRVCVCVCGIFADVCPLRAGLAQSHNVYYSAGSPD